LGVGRDILLREGDVVLSEEPLRRVAIRSGGLAVNDDFFVPVTEQFA